MKLKDLKERIDYLVINHPELAEELVAAEHDVLYLPAPKEKSKDFKKKLEEWGCGLEDNETIYCFV